MYVLYVHTVNIYGCAHLQFVCVCVCVCVCLCTFALYVLYVRRYPEDICSDDVVQM